MPGIRLSPVISIIQTDAGVLLRSDLGTFQLYGRDAQVFITAIVPLLDGRRNREAIVDALGQYSRHDVMALLDLLEQHGLLETLDNPGDERWSGQVEFFRKWTNQPDESMQRLSRARILIVGLEPWGAAAAIELAASGVGTLHLLDDGRVGRNDLLSVRLLRNRHLGRPRGEALTEVLTETCPWCRVASGPIPLTDDTQLIVKDTGWDLAIGAGTGDELLVSRSVARFAHVHNIPSLFAHIEGLEASVGPAVVPGQTACWNCARLRQLANSDRPEVGHALQAALLAGRPQPRIHTYLAPMAPLVGHVLAIAALNIVSHYAHSRLEGRVLIQNLETLETDIHTVIRMPWCDICGGASAGRTSIGGPVDGDQRASVGGSVSRGLREVKDIRQLRQLMAGWVDSRTGVIRHLMLTPPEPSEPELPITCSAVLSSYTEGTYAPHETRIGSGKGLTSVEAMIGAVGEAIERYSAARYLAADLHRAALNDLRDDALDPRYLCLYDDVQYDQPDFPFARFDPDRPIGWTRGYWLDTGHPVWMPALMTYFDVPAHSEESFCQVTTNGLAAGADLEDAALRAVLELVERDAFMTTWLAGRSGQSLLIDHTLDPGAREVVRRLGERGVDVELFLLDVGLGIPAIACVGFSDGVRWPAVAVGLGAHLSPRAAARKAVLELGSTGPYIGRLMGDRRHPIPREPEQVRSIIDHALFYAPARRTHVVGFLRNAARNVVALSELDEPKEVSLGACVARLTLAGVRVAIAEVTSPDVASSPFRVVRALGIDMQPFDFGFNLRRLANRRLKAMLVNGLNPHPHPLA